jgi:hypothetical protein
METDETKKKTNNFEFLGLGFYQTLQQILYSYTNHLKTKIHALEGYVTPLHKI